MLDVISPASSSFSQMRAITLCWGTTFTVCLGCALGDHFSIEPFRHNSDLNFPAPKCDCVLTNVSSPHSCVYRRLACYSPNEEEANAQFKAVFGGLGMCLSSGGVQEVSPCRLQTWLVEMLPPYFVAAVGVLRKRLSEKEGGTSEFLSSIAGSADRFNRASRLVIGLFLNHYEDLSAFIKILGLVSPTINYLSEARYSRLALPGAETRSVNPSPVSATRLILLLLAARLDAVSAVGTLETVTKDIVRKMGGE